MPRTSSTSQHAGMRRYLAMSALRRAPQTEKEAAALGESIKKLMRGSAQPVAIVSAFLPEDSSHAQPRFIHAATLSSFTTVSLAPPLVAFSIRQPSRIADALRAGAAVLEGEGAAPLPTDAVRHRSMEPHFLVHLLSSEQSPISDYFAQPGAQPYEIGADVIQEGHPFSTHPMQPSEAVDGQLVLREALGTMACSLVYQLDLTSPDLHGTSDFASGKHANEVGSVLFLAQIHAVEQGPDSPTPRRPLVYWNQKYCKPSESK